ncbi:YggS family pyridoxal phosphate-dependent enzyme [Pontibacter sp. G13]|uniref:YggS family pyridoxal phosphate-dependent enzyme n=1 Tax=Pontibacter sp. G13 TaxID=3074898 RepID=UPI003906CC9A
MSISANLQQIRERIASAAQAAGRKPESVQLIAVSKTKPMEMIREAYEASQSVFGENKVQELREKHPALPDAKWHMIGTLQRNKVKYIAPFIDLIHSVDSPRLLAEISKQAAKHERVIDCLLQINISHEDSKSGMEPSEAREILIGLDEYPNVQIVGLMGMAEFSSDETLVRGQFANLRAAKEQLESIQHPRVALKELSMGMSGDFEWAIAEGSTMVRVGSSIFGQRNYSV